jgi:hypothetical protein
MSKTNSSTMKMNPKGGTKVEQKRIISAETLVL